MKLAPVAVCLLMLTAGCIVQTDRAESETVTPSTPERVDGKAKTPTQPTTPSAPAYNVDVDAIEDVVHEKMNERRVANEVDPLNRSKKLDAIARYKSWDMAQRDYFSHRGLNGTTHKIMREKYESGCPSIGQNILKHPEGASTIGESNESISRWAQKTVNALMNSTGHRENILNPAYEVQGIGVFVDENGTVYLTQEFCG